MQLNDQDVWISWLGLSLIALVSLGYVLFGPSFAQLRVEFYFLDFPVFIGEILLGVTSVLFIFKNIRQGLQLGRWGWLLGGYLLFILSKASIGYYSWGPLALRDAALFYYFFFIALGYSFWSKSLGGDKIRRFLIVVILCIFVLHQFIAFWLSSLIILASILALQSKSVQERMVMMGAVFLLIPYNSLFAVLCRTVFLSTLVMTVFIAIIFFILFFKDRWVRLVGTVLGCLVLFGGIFIVGRTGVWSTFFVKGMRPMVTTLPQDLHRGKYLFHPVGSIAEKPDVIKEFIQRMNVQFLSEENQTIIRNGIFALQQPKDNEPIVERKIEVKKQAAVEDGNCVIATKKGDTLFRYYIWRDMIFEYAQFKPLFGFPFGRPLYSSTLKYYGLAGSTQECDGWIGAHNSFLYMIYRAGIVGLFMIAALLFVWGKLVRDFYVLKDWAGILLCAILLNWFVSANFFLIFELPYTAIPVWTIFGITLKHRALLKK